MVEIGDVVVYCDHQGRRLKGLLTMVWGQDVYPYTSRPCVNLVYVDPDPTKTDCYGRQIGRDASSVPYKSGQTAPGYYWEEIG